MLTNVLMEQGGFTIKLCCQKISKPLQEWMEIVNNIDPEKDLHSLPRTFVPAGLVTILILNFRTDMSGQTVQTQIRLLLEEQSDQDLSCLLFHLHTFRFFLFV